MLDHPYKMILLPFLILVLQGCAWLYMDDSMFVELHNSPVHENAIKRTHAEVGIIWMPIETEPFSGPALDILSIQSTSDPAHTFIPIGAKYTLYVLPGEYRVKLRCNRSPSDKDDYYIIRDGTAIGKDGIYTFSVKLPDSPTRHFTLDCAIDMHGQTYIKSGESEFIEVVG